VKAPRVIIESFRGNARITGVDGTTVKVTGRKTVRSMDQTGADRANTDSPFANHRRLHEITIRTNQDHVTGNHRITAELESAFRRARPIEAHGRTGDFDVTDVAGNVEIVSDNAGVRLQKHRR